MAIQIKRSGNRITISVSGSPDAGAPRIEHLLQEIESLASSVLRRFPANDNDELVIAYDPRNSDER